MSNEKRFTISLSVGLLVFTAFGWFFYALGASVTTLGYDAMAFTTMATTGYAAAVGSLYYLEENHSQ